MIWRTEAFTRTIPPVNAILAGSTIKLRLLTNKRIAGCGTYLRRSFSERCLLDRHESSLFFLQREITQWSARSFNLELI